MTSLKSLEVFCGELAPNRAVVYARLGEGAETAGASLAGSVRGPRCTRGSTLPATYRLASQPNKSGPGLLAQALVTEPIFWSPDWPALYDVSVELLRGGQVESREVRTIGLKPLRVLKGAFDYGGKRWVLRGVCRCGDLSAALDDCREQAAALIAQAELLDERLLLDASEQGTLVVALLSNGRDVAGELTRLSRFAAVAIAVLPHRLGLFGAPLATNILLAHYLKQGELEPPADDARLVFGEVAEPESFAAWARSLTRTVVALRLLAEGADVAAARAECDRLQRDLAPYGQFAGYVV